MVGASFWIESEIDGYLERLRSSRADSPALSASLAGSEATANMPLPKRPDISPSARKAPDVALAVTPASTESSARAIRAVEDVQRSIVALVKDMASVKADLAALRKHLGCRP